MINNSWVSNRVDLSKRRFDDGEVPEDDDREHHRNVD